MSSVIVERHPPVNKVITKVNSVQCVAGTIVIVVLIMVILAEIILPLLDDVVLVLLHTYKIV
jgi:hypothetical protein